MKTKLLVLVLLIVGLKAQATHLMGGQITSRNIGGLTYEVTLTVYRDTVGVPIYSVATFNYSDTSGVILSDTAAVSPALSIGNGVEQYQYIDTVTFPAAGNYTVSYTDCCRNGAILNLPNPLSNSMYLNNSLWADSTNSSPVFLNMPITLAQLGVPFLYNPLPYDADGDSLSWALDIPLDYSGDTIAGFTPIPSDTSMPFSLNPITGEISFLPVTTGNYVLSFIVTEYRNGVAIGFIRRDMQLLIINSSNIPVLVSTYSQVQRTAAAPTIITVNPGQSFDFSFDAIDPDGFNVSVLPIGDAFKAKHPPVVSMLTSGNSTAHADISWAPTAAEVRAKDYLLCFRITEKYSNYTFYSDYTYSISVESATGISEAPFATGSVSVYPNPMTSESTISFSDAKAGLVNYTLYNVQGQICTSGNWTLKGGKEMVRLNTLPAAAGMYFLRIADATGQSVNLQVMVK